MYLNVVGINHETAPVEIREQVIFNLDTLPQNLQELMKFPAISEVAILNTCNRTEVYCYSYCVGCSSNHICNKQCEASANANIKQYLSQICSNSDLKIEPFLYQFNHLDMIKHMMRVASGLNSMILGETQILGQMKNCFEVAQKAGTVKNILRQLFQETFSTAKRVRSHTAIGEKPVSIASTAIHLSKQFYNNISQQNILLIGSGKTIKLICKYLKNNRNDSYIIANRTRVNALKLVSQDEARTCSLQDITKYLANTDIVISCTSSPSCLVDKQLVNEAMKSRPKKRMLILDLAVPRDVAKNVDDLPEVYVYTVDDMATVIDQSLFSREDAKIQANQIIQEDGENFLTKLNIKNQVPTITQLRKQANETRMQLEKRAISQLDSGVLAKEVIKELSYKMTNSFLHSPTIALKKAAEVHNIETNLILKEAYRLK